MDIHTDFQIQIFFVYLHYFKNLLQNKITIHYKSKIKQHYSKLPKSSKVKSVP